MKIVTIDNLDFEVTDKVSDLILLISKERDELRDLAIWMTGCGYDFCQHKYFVEMREELLKNTSTDHTSDKS